MLSTLVKKILLPSHMSQSRVVWTNRTCIKKQHLGTYYVESLPDESLVDSEDVQIYLSG